MLGTPWRAKWVELQILSDAVGEKVTLRIQSGKGYLGSHRGKMDLHEALSFGEADLISGHIYLTLSILPAGSS